MPITKRPRWEDVQGKPTTIAGYGITDGATITQVTQAANPGTVAHFASSTPPNGWLACNGAAVSRSMYAALFNAIGTTYGAGDGSTTFNVPDLRGEFIRGWDNGRGVDSGRMLGSAQAQSVESHTHAPPAGLDSPWLGNFFSGSGAIDSTVHNTWGVRNPHSGNTQAYGGNETRPRNVALLACIKF